MVAAGQKVVPPLSQLPQLIGPSIGVAAIVACARDAVLVQCTVAEPNRRPAPALRAFAGVVAEGQAEPASRSAADDDALELAVGTCMAVVPGVVAVPPRCGGGGAVDGGDIGECIDFAVALAECKQKRGPFAWTCEDPALHPVRCVSNTDGSCTTICGSEGS